MADNGPVTAQPSDTKPPSDTAQPSDTNPASQTAPPATHDPSFLPADHIWLMRDFWRLRNSLPNNYRTMQTPFREQPGIIAPTRQGLDELNASGSGEFTRKSLHLLKQQIPQGFKLMIVDLMQESHGFVNGLAVTWYCGRDQINWGKTDEQIRQDENSRLRSVLKQGEATAFKYVKIKNPLGLESGAQPIKFKIKTAQNEEELCRSEGVEYIRIPVADDQAPANEQIDRFVNLVEHLDKKTWLHIHCAAGDGRTTSFLAFFDMMHNAHNVSFDDIINRQWLIGGFQLINGKPSAPWKLPYVIERRKTIRDFYDTWQHKRLSG